MMRLLALIYGAVCYLFTGFAVLYTAAFLNDAAGAHSLNRGHESTPALALFVDLALLALFGLQHSGMARQSFKRIWTCIVPQSVERSTYVLFSSLSLMLVCLMWRRMAALIFDLRDTFAEWPIWFIAGLGCLIALAATYQIDHWDLFGLRQVWDYYCRQESQTVPFQVPELYRFSRHPMMAGLLIALWATPTMTSGRLLFNLGFTLYILIALRWEERDLVAKYGDDYRKYRREVRRLF